MNRLTLIAALSLAGFPAAIASAAPAPASTSTTPAAWRDQRADWALQVTPYMWAAGLHGKVSPFQRGSTFDVDKTFSEVMDGLNVGGFVNLWARRDRLVLSANMMYVDSSDSRKNGPLPAFQVPGATVVVPPGSRVEGKMDTTQFMATLQGGYRLLDETGYTFDLLAGVRFWHVANHVTVSASNPAIGSVAESWRESFSWTDPLVGMRLFVTRLC